MGNLKITPVEEILPPLNTPITILSSTNHPLLENIELRPCSPLGFFRIWDAETNRQLPGNALTAEVSLVNRRCFVLIDENRNRLCESGWTYRRINQTVEA